MIEHSADPSSPLNMHLEAAQPYLLNKDLETTFDANKDFYAVVGIGFPQRFYKTLENMGIHQFQCHEFPDHYEYELSDLQFEDANPIITTEKDAVKILAILKNNPNFKREIWVVPVDAVFHLRVMKLCMQQLKQLGLKLPEGI